MRRAKISKVKCIISSGSSFVFICQYNCLLFFTIYIVVLTSSPTSCYSLEQSRLTMVDLFKTLHQSLVNPYGLDGHILQSDVGLLSLLLGLFSGIHGGSNSKPASKISTLSDEDVTTSKKQSQSYHDRARPKQKNIIMLLSQQQLGTQPKQK